MFRFISCLTLIAALVVALEVRSAHAAPIVRGTGNGALIGNDLTDVGNNGVEGGYVNGASVPPAVLSGFDARFFASSEANFGGGENAFNVFDNLTGGGNEKWCCEGAAGDPNFNGPGNGIGVFVGADFSQTLAPGPLGIVLDRFTLTASNDSPGRDPDVFSLQGSNDGTSWTDIYTFNSDGTNIFGGVRDRVLEFSVANGDFVLPAGYDQFRLFVDSVNGDGVFALSEIELFGNIANLNVPEPGSLFVWSMIALAGLIAGRRYARK